MKYWIFTDPQTKGFSFKKLLALCAALVFVYASIGLTLGLKDISDTAWAAIYGVFACYFLKGIKMPFELKSKK